MPTPITMKAARFHTFGGPEVLQIDDVPVPAATEGRVIIRVAGAAFNPADAALRAGLFAGVMDVELPFTPGVEVSGTIAEIGPGVDGWAIGDTVVCYQPFGQPGTYAEHVSVSADVLASAPQTVDLADAAALPAVGLTAWQALFDHGALQPGEKVLVNGAGSAVGAYVTQLAVHHGADVVAVAGTASCARVRAYAPRAVVDYQAGDLTDAIDEEFDLVVNLAPTAFADLLPFTRRSGRFVSATTPVDAENDRKVRAIRMGSRSDAAQLRELVRLVDDGKLVIWVRSKRPLADAADVHNGNRNGKTVFIPA